MTRDAWYRNTTWDDAIAEAFSAKLKRAREKGQYLRIQASYLTATYPDVALSLLDQYFALGTDFDYAQAHVDRAYALQAKGDLLGAIRSLESAIEREAEYPNLQDGFVGPASAHRDATRQRSLCTSLGVARWPINSSHVPG